MEVPGLSDPDIGDLGSLSQATFAVSIDPPPARSTSPPLPPRKNALGLPPTYLTHLRALLHQWLEQQTREDDLNTGHTPARLWDDQRLAQIEEAIWSGAVIPGRSREDAKIRLLQLDWQAWAPGSARRKTVWREHRVKVVAESKAKRDKADKGDTAKGKKAQEDAARGRLFAPTPVSATLTTPQKSPTRPASVASGGHQSRSDGSRSPMNTSPSRSAAEEPEDTQRDFNRLITGLKGYNRLSIAPADEWEVLADDLPLPTSEREPPGAFPQATRMQEPSLDSLPPLPPSKRSTVTMDTDELVKPLFCVHFPAPPSTASTSTIQLRRQSSLGHHSRDSMSSTSGRWWTGSGSGRRWSGIGMAFGKDIEQDVEVEFEEGKYALPTTISTSQSPRRRRPSFRRKGTAETADTATITTSSATSDDETSSTWSGTQKGSVMAQDRALSVLVAGVEDDVLREQAATTCLVGGTIIIRGVQREEERQAIQAVFRVLLYSLQTMMLELELLDAFRIPREDDPKPVSPKPLPPARQNSSPHENRPSSPALRRTVTNRERGERTKGFFQRLGKDTRGMLDNLMGKPRPSDIGSTISQEEPVTLSTMTASSEKSLPVRGSSEAHTPSIPHAADRHLRTLAKLEALLPSPSPNVRPSMPPLLLRVREEENMRSTKANEEAAEESSIPSGLIDGLTRLNSMSLAPRDTHRVRARAYRMGGDVKAGLCALMSGIDDFDGWSRLQRLELLSCTEVTESQGEGNAKTTICERPKATTYNFWNNDDETIQDVMNGIMSDEEHVCPRGGCDATREEHTRWWLHNGKKVGKLVRRVEQGMGEIGLDCWVKCAECKKTSTPKRLGAIASVFSWGKLLELILYTSILCPPNFCPHLVTQPSPIITHIRSPHIVLTLFVGDLLVHDTRLPKLQVGPNVAKRKAGRIGAVGTVDGLMKKDAKTTAVDSLHEDIAQIVADLRRRLEIVTARKVQQAASSSDKKEASDERSNAEEKSQLDSIELKVGRAETDLVASLAEAASGQLNDVRQNVLSTYRKLKAEVDDSYRKLGMKEEDFGNAPVLPCYFSNKVHAPPGSSFLVREEEPSSIISYALSSIAYFSELTANGKLSLDEVAKPETFSNGHGWTTEMTRKDTPRDILSLRTITKKRSDASVMKHEHRVPLSVAPNQPSLEVSLEQVEGRSQVSDTLEDLVRSIGKATAQDPILTMRARAPSISDSESGFATPRPSTMSRRTSDSIRLPPSAFKPTRSVSGASLATPVMSPAPSSIAGTPRSATPAQDQSKEGWSSVTSTFTNSFNNFMRMGSDVGSFRMRGADRSLSALMGPLGMMSMDNSLSSSNQDDRPHLHFTYTLPEKLKISCTIYYATSFDSLRRRCAIDRSILESLSRCDIWDAQGGKSKASFFMTQDKRYIVKELVTKWNVSDLQALLEIAPSYFEHLANTHNKAVALAKIVGFYTVKTHDLQTSNKKHMDLMVMENLFYKQSISQTYDLKGIEGRKVPKAMADGSTLFDSEWIEGQTKAPILLHPHAKRILQEAIYNDTKYLCSQSIMDYSLLLGLDTTRREIVVGLVDAIGSYSLFKTIESRGKLALTRGGEVTIIPPDQYRDRFESALKHYFIACPDKWSKPARRQGLDDPLPSVM